MGVGKNEASFNASGGGTASSWEPLMPKLHPSYDQPVVALDIPMGKVAQQTEQDMLAARLGAEFDVNRMHEYLRGSKEEVNKVKRIVQAMSTDELFCDFRKRSEHWSREQRVQMGHRAIRRVTEIANREGWDPADRVTALSMMDVASPLSLHHIAHIPPILGQGTPEQIARWVGPANATRYIGCYAQSELGHGTNVLHLETTATYIPDTDELEIHSPTLTSTKWWIGGGGLSATHAIVQAQLYLAGKSYGPHLFFVPLRSLEDHSVLPGVVCGDIGPKVYGAYSFIDNGWIRFDHVRIPRDNMLMKNAKVTQEGQYIKPPNAKLSYGGMLYIRARMTTGSAWLFSKAVTIAIRYSLIRRQFRDPDAPTTALERSVLSYPSVSRRLVPLIAKVYAFVAAGQRMQELYNELSGLLAKGDMSLLADAHVASSALKAYVTKEVLVGVEECRQALGGHGFSVYSGFNPIFAAAAPAVTFEGDNYVLMQQVGRALVKLSSALRKDANTPTSSTTSYVCALTDASSHPFRSPTSARDWLRPEVYLAALNLRAARVLADFEAEMHEGGKRRVVDLSWECVELSRCHCEVVISQWFEERVDGVRQQQQQQQGGNQAPVIGSAEGKWLEKVAQLQALTSLSRNITPLALPFPKSSSGLAGYEPGTSIVDAKAVSSLEAAIRGLVEELLPQVIPLTDAFHHSDWELNSALGRRDGRVYQALMSEAEGNPLNHRLSTTPPSSKADGAYTYGEKSGGGKHVVGWYEEELRPLFMAAAKRAGEEAIRGDGSKL